MTARLRDDSNMKACWEEERWVKVEKGKFKSRQGVCSTTNRICIHGPVLPGSVFSLTNSGKNVIQIWQCNAGISPVSGVTLDSLHAQESQVVPKALVKGLLMIVIRF